MNPTNWPGGTDRANSNWTGRSQRTSDWGGNWAPNSHTPPWGWPRTLALALAAILLAVVLLHIGAAVGL